MFVKLRHPNISTSEVKLGPCSSPKSLSQHHPWSAGRSCYSCRAFFRRTVERVNRKGLKKCKTGRADCLVTESDKSCIHCRYTKCLNIGMRPDLLKGKRKKYCEETVSVRVPESEDRASSPSMDLSLLPGVLQQTDLLLQTDPMYQSIQRFSHGGELTDVQVEELLKETLQEMEKQGLWEKTSLPSFTRNEVWPECEGEGERSYHSVISGPEMCLTTEEIHRLEDLVRKQVTACKSCMPVR